MILEKLKQDLIGAMKAKNEAELSTLRMLDAVIKNKVIEIEFRYLVVSILISFF